MNVRNCRTCGRLFNYLSGPITCPKCREEIEAKFQDVKKYIQNNRGATIAEVADEFELDPQQIRQWVREERLAFSDDSPIRINCETCGTMIRTGRFCEACKNSMNKSFSQAIGIDTEPKKPASRQIKPEKEAPKMRFLDR